MIVFSVNLSYSQTGINFDFAYGATGNYTFWKGYQAQNNSSSSTISFSSWVPFNQPTDIFWQGSPCFVINSDLNATDSYAPSIKKVPTGYIRSTQINCAQNNKNSNMLTYDLFVNDTN